MPGGAQALFLISVYGPDEIFKSLIWCRGRRGESLKCCLDGHVMTMSLLPGLSSFPNFPFGGVAPATSQEVQQVMSVTLGLCLAQRSSEDGFICVFWE